MINNITIMGRLTADPELVKLEASEYCRFSIATARPKKKDVETAETDFFSCISWNSTANIIAKYLSKGDMIVIGGHLRNNVYKKNGEKRVFTEILVREIHFTGTKKSEEQELPALTEYTEENPPF